MTVDDVLSLLALVNPPMTAQVRSSNCVMGCPFAAVSGHRSAVDRTPSLGILPDDRENGGTWNCFSCGRKGDIRHFFRLLAKETAFDVTAATAQLESILHMEPDAIAAAIPPYAQHFAVPAHDPYRTFPESWLAPYKGRISRSLMDTRGIALDTVKSWGLGFDRIHQRNIYPVRDSKNSLVGAVGGLVRDPAAVFRVKYKNYWHRLCPRCSFPLDHKDGQYLCGGCQTTVPAERAVEGFRKAQHLFGAQWFTTPTVAVIVEGVVDALAIWQATRGWKDPYGCSVAPLALLGSSPSQAQADLIVQLTADRRVVVFLDNDDAGAKGNEQLYNLLASRLRYFRVDYDDPEPRGDPASYADKKVRPMKEIQRMLSQARVVMRVR